MPEENIDCQCNNLGYDKFDIVAAKELFNPIKLDQIVNGSYCNHFIINEAKNEDNAALQEVFIDLNGKIGVYCLWMYIGECTSHGKQKYKCLYVGKGHVVERLKEHIKEKWNYPMLIHITFFECENRIAKYVEQLCLDSYELLHNEKENYGQGPLFAMWSRIRAEPQSY